MPYRLAELAETVGGKVRGDPERSIAGLRSLEAAGPDDLSFLTNPKFRELAEQSAAGTLLVGHGLDETGPWACDLLIVDDPYPALVELLRIFYPVPALPAGIHPTAVIEDGCSIDPAAHIGAYVVVGAGSEIAADAIVHPLVAIGRGCRIGSGAVIYSHVTIYDRSEIGERSVVHAGTVLGADGFGYAARDGRPMKLPQVGRVVLEEEVEIGANSAVDRAALEVTRVGAGTKIDNLVQVAHNVTIGRACVICGQAGVSGSASLGDGVLLAGQSGVADHVRVGDGGKVAGKASVFKSVEPGKTVAGTPAIPIHQWRRQSALLGRLEEMKRQLKRLEREIAALKSREKE